MRSRKREIENIKKQVPRSAPSYIIAVHRDDGSGLYYVNGEDPAMTEAEIKKKYGNDEILFINVKKNGFGAL